jgi:hypothetical protein
MSVVVEQILPYTTTELKLEDPKRWSRLFPLIRPSIKAVETANGQTIVIDTALTGSKNVLIVAIGSVGNFSSKILSESHLAAFATRQSEQSTISTEDIHTILWIFSTKRGCRGEIEYKTKSKNFTWHRRAFCPGGIKVGSCLITTFRSQIRDQASHSPLLNE